MKNLPPLLLVLSLTLLACSDGREDLLNCRWKYGDGYHIGDWIDSNTFIVRNDTLFRDGAAQAIVYKVEKRLAGDDVLMIRALGSGEKGWYFGK